MENYPDVVTANQAAALDRPRIINPEPPLTPAAVAPVVAPVAPAPAIDAVPVVAVAGTPPESWYRADIDKVEAKLKKVEVAVVAEVKKVEAEIGTVVHRAFGRASVDTPMPTTVITPTNKAV